MAFPVSKHAMPPDHFYRVCTKSLVPPTRVTERLVPLSQLCRCPRPDHYHHAEPRDNAYLETIHAAGRESAMPGLVPPGHAVHAGFGGQPV